MNGHTARQSITEVGQHRKVLPTTTVLGKIAKVGYYRDTLPLMIITIKKEDAGCFPYREGDRISVPFVIDGQLYIAGIRTTARSATIMICSDLMDKELNTVRLADLLLSQRRAGNVSVLELKVENGIIHCL